jgi:F-type H+-transporting ATPase subunit b
MIDLDGSLLLQVGVFFLLYAMLKRWAFGPMLALFDARQAAIDGAKKEARALEAEAEAKLRAFENEMKKVKVEVAAEREAIRQDAARLERELLAKARADADQVLADATAHMMSEAAQIREHIKTETPQLAAQIAGKLLGRKVAS